jgi:hypothetical protein
VGYAHIDVEAKCGVGDLLGARDARRSISSLMNVASLLLQLKVSSGKSFNFCKF